MGVKNAVSARVLSDIDWTVWKNEDGTYDNTQAQLAVMTNIRDELKKLNRLLGCPNFTDIPRILRKIAANTTKPKRKRAKK